MFGFVVGLDVVDLVEYVLLGGVLVLYLLCCFLDCLEVSGVFVVEVCFVVD